MKTKSLISIAASFALFAIAPQKVYGLVVTVHPRIDHIVPSTPTPGSVVRIMGYFFDHDEASSFWQGQPPYEVFVPVASGLDGIYESVPFTYISDKELDITLPTHAVSGQLRMKFRSLSPVHDGTSDQRIAFTHVNIQVIGQPEPTGTGFTLINDNQYTLLDVISNGASLMPTGAVLPPNGFMHFTGQTGAMQLTLKFGPVTGNATPFTTNLPVSYIHGTVQTINLNPIDVATLLAGNNTASTNFVAQFVADGRLHNAVLTITGSSYSLRVNGVLRDSGTLKPTSWPDNANDIDLELRQTGPLSGNQSPFLSTTSLPYPFHSFSLIPDARLHLPILHFNIH